MFLNGSGFGPYSKMSMSRQAQFHNLRTSSGADFAPKTDLPKRVVECRKIDRATFVLQFKSEDDAENAKKCLIDNVKEDNVDSYVTSLLCDKKTDGLRQGVVSYVTSLFCNKNTDDPRQVVVRFSSTEDMKATRKALESLCDVDFINADTYFPLPRVVRPTLLDNKGNFDEKYAEFIEDHGSFQDRVVRIQFPNYTAVGIKKNPTELYQVNPSSDRGPQTAMVFETDKLFMLLYFCRLDLNFDDNGGCFFSVYNESVDNPEKIRLTIGRVKDMHGNEKVAIKLTNETWAGVADQLIRDGMTVDQIKRAVTNSIRLKRFATENTA